MIKEKFKARNNTKERQKKLKELMENPGQRENEMTMLGRWGKLLEQYQKRLEQREKDHKNHPEHARNSEQVHQEEVEQRRKEPEESFERWEKEMRKNHQKKR
jgi:hypothetical protein